jgi:hypothetical protein
MSEADEEDEARTRTIRSCPRRDGQSNPLNCSSVSPASRTIPAIVNALIGFALGIVMMRPPSVITMCLPWRAIRKPAFSNALTAC